jgi:hypothetical protein
MMHMNCGSASARGKATAEFRGSHSHHIGACEKPAAKDRGDADTVATYGNISTFDL